MVHDYRSALYHQQPASWFLHRYILFSWKSCRTAKRLYFYRKQFSDRSSFFLFKGRKPGETHPFLYTASLACFRYKNGSFQKTPVCWPILNRCSGTKGAVGSDRPSVWKWDQPGFPAVHRTAAVQLLWLLRRLQWTDPENPELSES